MSIEASAKVEAAKFPKGLLYAVKPKASLHEVRARKTDPKVVAEFATDILDQVAGIIDDTPMDQLPSNLQYALGVMATGVEKYCGEDSMLSGHALYEIVQALYYNASDLLDREWLEQNPRILDQWNN